MRTSILSAAILGLFAAGCAGELSGTGDDTQNQPGVCGDGALNSGETCDDGNTTSGDGCSATCTNESSVPRVQVAMDKTTLTTDLYVENEINLTLTGMNGFAGDVTLAASVVDGTDTAITGWTTTLSSSTLTLTADGMGTAKLVVRVPGDAAITTGTVKITATSSAAPQTATLGVTGSNKAVIQFGTTANNCINPTAFNQSNPFRVKVGRMISVINGSDPAGTSCGGGPCKMQIHFDGGTGVAHQNNQMIPGASYDQLTTTANATGVTFYCHNAQLTDTAVELGGQVRLRLITVP